MLQITIIVFLIFSCNPIKELSENDFRFDGLTNNTYIKPLALRDRSGYGESSWEYGAHVHLGIKAVLCEGAGAIYTKEENKKSGVHLIESLASYYKGTKD